MSDDHAAAPRPAVAMPHLEPLGAGPAGASPADPLPALPALDAALVAALAEPALLVWRAIDSAVPATVAAANRAAAALVGVAASAMRGAPLTALLAESPPDVHAYLDACARTRSPVPGALHLTGAGGTPPVKYRCDGVLVRPAMDRVPALVLLRLRSASDAAARFLLVNRQLEALGEEIRVRRRAEAALRASEERLSLALEAASDGLWDHDLVTGSVYYGPRWAGMLGYAAEELAPTAATYDGLVHPEDRRRALDAFEAHATGRTPSYEVEIRLRHRDGGWRWVLARGRVVARAADGAPLRVVGTHADITERKALEAERMAALSALEAANDQLEGQRLELELANQQLHEQTVELELQTDDAERARDEAERAREDAERANRAKSDFLAVMSHELRTPLNAIAGHVQLLEMELHGPVTPAQQEALGRIGRAGRHLLRLIDDVLSFARLDAGRMDYAVRPVSLAEVIADAAAMVEPQVRARGLTFAVRLPPPSLAAWADGEKLRQVLLNLLANALKFTAPGGEVSVQVVDRPSGTEASPELVYLRVADTGEGIPAAKLEAVFEPFVQVTAGRTRRHGGTGLGLAISRDLARGMGGDLRVRSVVGLGSAFTVSLRRALEPAADAPDGARADPADDGGETGR